MYNQLRTNLLIYYGTDVHDNEVKTMKEGKSSGPFANLTDVLIETANFLDGITGYQKYSAIFNKWIEISQQGHINKKAVPAFSSVSFFALHNRKSNMDKIRNIGAGIYPHRFF